ncbi:hypothetical protein DY000_02040299 [Brassica cretica]|uniref:Uncharacterized protein n=1 Tax=Brassica cretica TaxID=69181 RepID=A0ABQ7BE60_BRACR|nr:hypothetical protein DY000_02040299 [Brassica cretica]
MGNLFLKVTLTIDPHGSYKHRSIPAVTEVTVIMQMMTDMMERLAKQDKAKKANNKRLNVISNALTPPAATDGEQTPSRVYSLLQHMELVVRPVGKSPTCQTQYMP